LKVVYLLKNLTEMKKIRRQAILLIATFVFALALCSTVAAAENTTTGGESGSVVDSGSNLSQAPAIGQTGEVWKENSSGNTQSQIVISGFVADCQTKSEFPNVTVTVKNNNTALATTKTGSDGRYNLSFVSVDRVFNVTASYPGHIPSTMEVTVSPNGSSLYGTTDFELGKPKVAIFLHSAHFGDKAAFELVPESIRPVNLSFYNTLNASNYINELLNLKDYEVIIVRSAGMGDRGAQVNALLPILKPARDAGAKIASIDVPHNISTINLTVHPNITGYFDNMVWFGTAPQSTNALNLMNYIFVNFMNGTAKVQPPKIRPAPGIYHPDATEFGFVFDNAAEYIAWSKNRTNNAFNKNNITIGILACPHFTSGYVMDEFIRQIESRNVNVIVAYPIRGMMRGRGNPDTNLFYNEGVPVVDAIITFQSFLRSVPDSMRIQQFKEFNVPVFGAVSLGGMFGNTTEDAWRKCPRGINLNHVGFFLSPLEMIGVAAPTVVATMGTDRFGATVDVPIPSQVTRLVDRTINHAELRRTPNQDKKIALIHFEYAASGLNNPRSIERLLKSLSDVGYTVDLLNESELISSMYAHGRNIGKWAQPTLDNMVQNHRDEVVLIPIREYRNWFNEMIPEHRRQEVTAFWGIPEDGSMVVNYNGEPHFVFPRVNAGNIMIMPQPARGGGNVSNAVIHHDLATPPTHQYIAFYLWLQRQSIDAIIHFGTHGSQEWLPGKERGLDDFSCWPSLMSGEIPIIYPYIVDNVGEAIHAKRRGDAVIISHMTPQLVVAGLHGELRTLHDLIHRYRGIADPIVREVELRMVIGKALNMSIDLDMNMPGFKGIPWDSNLTELIHMHIHDVESQAIPVGLHILGEIPNQTLLYESVMKIMGPSFIDEIIRVGNITGDFKCDIEEEARTKAKSMLYGALLNTSTLREIQIKMLGNSSDNLTQYLENGTGHLRNFLSVDAEINSIISALSGRFISPGPGGDPLRNPDSLPTGRNLYSFDPRTIPTKAAWEVGKVTMGAFIADFHKRNGRYPDKLAFVLFAGETMRQNGVAEAQILYALGVRPIWDTHGRIRVDQGVARGLEIIPDTELGRPRIDVVVTMTCLYRDVFSCRVEVIDAAVRLAIDHIGNATITNHVRSNYQNLTRELIDMGYDPTNASNLASARIFGPPSGGYGLGLSGATLSGGTWDERSQLAKLYLDRLGNIYSQNSWGESNRLIFERALSGTDAAIFSRSSNQYGVITTDHPFEWLGGLSMAVEQIDGTAPELLITDLRNPHANGKVVSLNQFLRMELRARQYNPRYIKGLMEHGWAGAQELANTISNLYGWQVVSPGIVTNDMWNELYGIYIQDKLNFGVDEFFNKYNPFAKQKIMLRMLESVERGFWNADSATVNELMERLIKSVAEHGLSCSASHCANPRIDKFIDEQIRSGNLNLDRDTLGRFDTQVKNTLGRESNRVDMLPTPQATPTQGTAGADAPATPTQGTAGADAPATPTQGTAGADAPATPGTVPGQTPAGADATGTQGMEVPAAEAGETGDEGQKAYEVAKTDPAGAPGAPGETLTYVAVGLVAILALLGAGFFKESILSWLGFAKK